MTDTLDDLPFDHDYDGEQTCQRCDADAEGMIIVCIDDMCRGSDGCGRYDDPSCYQVCPDCGGKGYLDSDDTPSIG